MSESLDQLLADLSLIDRYLEIETFLGRFSSRELPLGAAALAQSGLEDREFYEFLSKAHLTSKAARSSLPVVTGTLLLYATGRFESFVRECIESAAREIGTKCGKFDSLPKTMRVSLLELTAEVMMNPRKYGHAENGVRAFVRRLAAGYVAITQDDPVNFECISVTDANMRPDILKEICERIGISDIWASMSAQAPMMKFFGNMDAGAVKKEAQSKLNEMMDDRNSIAHPAGTTTFPSSDKVSNYVSFLRDLCTVLESVVETHVAVVQPVAVVIAEAQGAAA
jgi:hypothetical protein